MLDRTQAPPFAQAENIDLTKAETIKLDNGVPVHIIRAGTQPAVKLEIVIPAGKWYEPKNGLAWFTTKMLKEGTQHKSSEVISSLFDYYGVETEFETSLDRSEVSMKVMNKHLPNILAIIHEMLYAPSFPDNELETLRNIKIQESRVENNQNHTFASRKFRELVYGADHPYGKFFTEEAMRDISKEDIKAYHQSHIKDTEEFVIAGRVEDEHLKLINNIFGQKKLDKPQNESNYNPSPGDKSLYVEKEHSLQTSLRIGRETILKSHEDFIDLKIATTILGGYFGSRLMKNIREEKGYTYGISSTLLPLEKSTILLIGSDVIKEYRNEAVEEIFNEIRNLRTKPVSESEMDTVQNYMIGAFLGSIDTPSDLADKFKNTYYLGLDYGYYQRFMNRVRNITPERIMEITEKYLHEDTLHHVLVG
ncbi:M16 family metallopeptidase [Roseivirga sp. BDSF3-8]|uniref:M16 family metallopeptidase n=1 Tax=Roseivirga sp. BDSF3-8 TaxID=3241598 RepID=UPI0035326480